MLRIACGDSGGARESGGRLAIIQVRDANGLDQGGSSGRKQLDSGYIWK